MPRQLFIPRWGLSLSLLISVSLTQLLGPSAVQAANWPSGFIAETVVSGLGYPVSIAFAPDGRMFIAQKNGRVRVFQNGSMLPEDFISLTTLVNNYWDRGLIGIAVHPNFPTQPYVYVFYTYDPPGVAQDGTGGRVSRLVRYTADAAYGYNRAVSGSSVVLLGNNSTLANIGNPADGTADDIAYASCAIGGVTGGAPIQDCLASDGPSHTVGTLMFGADGALYVSHGDGASFTLADPRALRALDVNSLNGKILRINPANGQGYSNNPFYDGNLNSNRSKVWSYGFRNPFRFTLHPSTGEVYIGDVGWSKWEEINVGKGKNFGWPCYEGGNGVSLAQPSYASSSATEDTCSVYYGGGFPSASTLDNFNRANGGMGSHWGASTTGYAISSNQLRVSSGGNVFWKASSFGPNQEVFVKLANMDNSAQEINLLLKAQSSSAYDSGVLKIQYAPAQEVVRVWTFTNAQGWVQRGTDMPVSFDTGDRFGARATAGGLVQVFRNSTLVGSADITEWPLYTAGGYIGLWMINVDNTLLDDFGGGNSSASGGSSVQAPVYAYQHAVINGENQGSAVQVGAFYSGAVYPAQYRGALFYQDYNNDWIKYLKFDAQGNAASYDFGVDVSLSSGGPVQLITGPDTNLYYVMYNGSGSEVRRIRYIGGGNTPPTANATASPTDGQPPLAVNFSSQGSYDPDGQAITYQWNFGNGVTSTQANPSYTYNSPGLYTAVLTATDTAGASSTDSVLIIVGNTAPVATITAPISGTTYSVGDVINFSGSANDAEEGNLADSRLTWEVLLHHNAHIHYNYFTAAGASGAFTAPDHGDGTSMELCLTATDVGNLSHTVCRALLPKQTLYTFLTNPPGLELVYASSSFTAPFTATSIVSSTLQLTAPFIQNGLTFDSWSDGGPRDRQLIIGATPLTLTASYINHMPTLSPFGAQTIDEDGSTGHLAFTVNDNETPSASLVLTATSSNPALVLPSGLVLSGSGENRTLRVTPKANQFGAATITLSVMDSRGGLASTSFTLTVNSVNDLPSAGNDHFVMLQGVNQQILASALLANDTDADVGDVLTITSLGDTLPGHGTATFNNGMLIYTPHSNFTGVDAFTYQVSDGRGGIATGTVTINVVAITDRVYLPLVAR